MISDIALTLIFGKPAIMYGGIFSLLLMLSAAAIPILNSKGIHTVPFHWHQRLAVITIIVALIHALFGLSIFFNF